MDSMLSINLANKENKAFAATKQIIWAAHKEKKQVEVSLKMHHLTTKYVLVKNNSFQVSINLDIYYKLHHSQSDTYKNKDK